MLCRPAYLVPQIYVQTLQHVTQTGRPWAPCIRTWRLQARGRSISIFVLSISKAIATAGACGLLQGGCGSRFRAGRGVQLPGITRLIGDSFRSSESSTGHPHVQWFKKGTRFALLCLQRLARSAKAAPWSLTPHCDCCAAGTKAGSKHNFAWSAPPSSKSPLSLASTATQLSHSCGGCCAPALSTPLVSRDPEVPR